MVVYPAGFRHPYPSTVSAKLIEQLLETGCLLSEHPPDEPLQRYAFPARHRITVGLSQLVVLVESAKRGGAMQIARHAQTENRDVYALPGDLGKARSEGANLLIREHVAQILSSTEDLLRSLRLQHTSRPSSPLQHTKESLSQEEQKIIEAIGTNTQGLHIDHISERTNFLYIS